MKKAWLALCLLVLAPVTSFSQTPSAPPIDIAAILGASPVTGSCAVHEGEGLSGSIRQGATQEKSLCTVTISCGRFGSLSCSSNNSATACSGVDRDCPQKGYVTCDGITTYCPNCTIEDSCYECSQSGGADCFSCCRCNGGTVMACAQAC